MKKLLFIIAIPVVFASCEKEKVKANTPYIQVNPR